MQKSLTPRQKLEYEKLHVASKQAESAMLKAELASGKTSPEYAVAERQKDEILAKMQRLTRALAPWTVQRATKSRPQVASSPRGSGPIG
jgi:hypothetical protein